MLTTPYALFYRICQYAKQHGVAGPSKYRDEWLLKLPCGVEIMVAMEDAGYTHSLHVRGLISCWHQYSFDHHEKVNFGKGDQNGLLTVARLIGFQVKY